MRNLKRVLSLALASAMLLGMMVMGAGAADLSTDTYKDSDSINYKEAVSVATSIGVFQGTDGNFLPAATLTRESAAKIITYLVMGKAAADKLTTTTAPFNDVAANRWSAGSIAYCVSEGILSGDGQGSFFPERTITGVQFSKMLLVALGNNATTEGYVGTGYEMKITTAANKAKLNGGLDIALSSELTREQAAQMVLNTLGAKTVYYEGGFQIGDITANATRKESTDSFAKTNYPALKKDANSTVNVANYGRPSYNWKNGKDLIGNYGASPVLSYDGKLTKAVADADLSGYDYASARVYLDGVEIVAASSNLTQNDIITLTGPGRVVEFYEMAGEDNAGKIQYIVAIDTYTAKISSVNSVAKSVALSVDGKVGVTIKESDNKALYNTLVDFGKDARVLVNYSNTKIVSATEAETVTGTYEQKTTAGKRIVGGTTYDDSYKAHNLSAMAIGTEYDLLLDNAGNIIFATATEESNSTTKTGYILNTDKVGSASTGGNNYKALVLFEDGTQEWVTTLKIGGNKATDTDGANSYAAIKGRFVTYVAKDSGYEFTALAQWATPDATPNANTPADNSYKFSNTEIKKNTVKFMNDGTNNVMGNDKTVFLLGNSSDGSYKAYTGVKNIPGWTMANGQVLVAKGTTTAKMVVIYGASNSVSASDLVFLTSGKFSETYDKTADTAVYTYQGIKNGEVVDIKTTTKVDATSTALAAGLYQIKSYDGDYASKLELTTTPAAANVAGIANVATDGVLTVKDGIITVTAGVFSASDEMVIHAVDKTTGDAGTISASDVEFYNTTNNTVVLMKDATGFITEIIFVYTPA